MVMQDEIMVEMGLADQEEVNLSKSKAHLRSSPHKADLANFDREKFYRRIGVDPEKPEEDQDLIMVAEMLTSEYGSVGLADKDEIDWEKVNKE